MHSIVLGVLPNSLCWEALMCKWVDYWKRGTKWSQRDRRIKEGCTALHNKRIRRQLRRGAAWALQRRELQHKSRVCNIRLRIWRVRSALRWLRYHGMEMRSVSAGTMMSCNYGVNVRVFQVALTIGLCTDNGSAAQETISNNPCQVASMRVVGGNDEVV